MSASCVTILDPILVALHVEWSTILAVMHAYLHSALDKDTRDYTPNVTESTQRRLLEFNKLNARIPDRDISRSDMIFVLGCYAICCKLSSVRRMSILTDAADICAQLCVIGSRHTASSRARSIDVDSTMHLLHQTASWLVQFGSTDKSSLTRALDSAGKMCVAPSVAKELRDLMILPSASIPIVDSVRDQADATSLQVFALQNNDVEMEDDVAKEEDKESQSQRGDFWMVETQLILHSIVSFASRIFHQISLEQYIFSLCVVAVDDPYTYPPAALTNLRSTVLSRCATTAGDSFVPLFREAVHRWCLPMGTLSIRYRRAITQFQQSSSATMMEQQLGMDTSQALYNVVNVPLVSIASNEQHELHDLLMFFTLGTLIENRCGVDFASCVVHSFDLAARHPLITKTIESHEARRPLIVSIMQKTWVHDQGLWYKCESLVDAILKWIVMIKYAYKITDASKASRYSNKLKNRNLTAISDLIIGGNLHTMVPSWK